tara:strand:- start:1394 stop:1513 length:120 start_codon:yes stop_codon:yes gene_type:complete
MRRTPAEVLAQGLCLCSQTINADDGKSHKTAFLKHQKAR